MNSNVCVRIWRPKFVILHMDMKGTMYTCIEKVSEQIVHHLNCVNYFYLEIALLICVFVVFVPTEKICFFLYRQIKCDISKQPHVPFLLCTEHVTMLVRFLIS